jgi:hypothetical protein
MVAFGRRTKKESPAVLARRIAHLPTSEFTPWIEQCLYTIGRSVLEYNRDLMRTELLDEAAAASEVCTELIEELKRRAVV